MRSVMGIVHPDRGAVKWSGHDVAQPDRLRFGYMPEERGLYPQMRLGAQVAYFARLHGFDAATADGAARTWLGRLGLGDRTADKLVALSHGNQQRVQLAVALVHDPELLVLDEPFAGLDPEAVDSLSQVLLERAAAGTAVLFFEPPARTRRAHLPARRHRRGRPGPRRRDAVRPARAVPGATPGQGRRAAGLGTSARRRSVRVGRR
ncbi:MAG TPA: ATP-binding cassette domain-containing protein [Solirubrobacteraceae bacterium]|nr:ATP-binding cassette domain-containing protein [Solirubrobacteraceae bacterium]